MRFFLSCDGEAKQIETFQDDDIAALFQTALVDFAKTPASCSAICQASDASPFFKATKKRLANYVVTTDPIQDDANEYVVEQLRDFIADKFSPNKKTIILKSLLKVVEAIRETLTMKIVRDGYAAIGQWPIDFVSAMNQCPTIRIMTSADYKKMKDSVDAMADIFRERGVITEAEMDDLGIPDYSEDRRKTPKDERNLSQQRAVVMNSTECVRQYKEYQQRLQARRASAGQATTSNGTRGPTDSQLYKSWCLTLTHQQAREEAVLCEAAGGKVSRRKQKAAELRAQGWTAPTESTEN